MSECEMFMKFLLTLVSMIGSITCGLAVVWLATEMYKDWKVEKDGDNNR